MKYKKLTIGIGICVLIMIGLVIPDVVLNNKLTASRTVNIELTQEEINILNELNFDAFFYKEVYEEEGTCIYRWGYNDANGNTKTKTSRFNCDKMDLNQKNNAQQEDFAIQIKELVSKYEKYTQITKTGEITSINLVAK